MPPTRPTRPPSSTPGSDPANADGVVEALRREAPKARVILPESLLRTDLPTRLSRAARQRAVFLASVPPPEADAGFAAAFERAFDRSPGPYAKVGHDAMRGVLAAIAEGRSRCGTALGRDRRVRRDQAAGADRVGAVVRGARGESRRPELQGRRSRLSHHHHHHVDSTADRGPLTLALALIAGFMVIEVVAGIVAGSLALLSDAAHMLTDAAAIGLALLAARFAARPARGSFTFGFRRAEILSAQINGAALLALGAVILSDGIRRLSDPPEVEGAIVVVVGLVGALVNVGAAAALARAQRQSLNVEGARQHVLMDLYASFGAVLAGAIVLLWGYDRADPIVALLIAVLMFRSAISLLRESGRVLLEAAPRGMDVEAIGQALAAHHGVLEVHDLHVWEVTSGFPALAAHVLVEPDDDCHATRRELQVLLRERFALEHTTLQVDHGPSQGLVNIDQAE